MPKLYIVESFQFKGKIFRSGEQVEDATVTVSEEDLLEELEKGKHPKTKKWLSPLLNHCVPADKEAKEIMGGDVKKAESDKDDEDKIKALRAEFDKIGAAFDPRWKAPRLEMELTKAKKEKGE